MSDPPETRYATTSDGVHVALQEFGSGAQRVIVVGEWMSNVEATWEAPGNRRVLQWLGSFCRVANFDNRGVGLSDHVPADQPPELEHWAQDIQAVLDALGWEDAVLLCTGAGTALSVVFATTFPRRTAGLVVVNGYPRYCEAPDYPCGAPAHAVEALRELFLREWGTGRLAVAASPGAYDSEAASRLGRQERLLASPGTAAALAPLQYRTDVRAILPLIQAPTLVIHRRDNRYVRVGHGRYLAEHIPTARYVELPGADQGWHVGFEDYADELEEFLTGEHHHPAEDRLLTTLMFVDIVASTSQTAAVGDRSWESALQSFDGLIDRQLRRFRGQVVNTRGDDYLAMFDGPAPVPWRAQPPSEMVCEAWDSKFESDSILERSCHIATTSLGSPWTSPRAYADSPSPRSCWYPARSLTSWWGRASPSRTEASTSSRVFPTRGSCFAWVEPRQSAASATHPPETRGIPAGDDHERAG